MKEILVSVPVSIAHIHNAIIGAFEGGSTYWLYEANPIDVTAHHSENLVWWGEQSVFENDFSFEVVYDDPNEEEGSATGRKIIDRDAVAAGLKIMAIKEASHFADLITEDDDAITHDVFMQCVVLGEVIYG